MLGHNWAPEDVAVQKKLLLQKQQQPTMCPRKRSVVLRLGTNIIELLKNIRTVQQFDDPSNLKWTSQLLDLLDRVEQLQLPKKVGRPARTSFTVEEELRAVLRPLAVIKKSRARITTLPGDVREHGLVLAALCRLLNCRFNWDAIRTALDAESDLIQSQDRDTFRLLLQLTDEFPAVDVAQEGHHLLHFLPPTLTTLAGYRGILLYTPTLQSQAQDVDEALAEQDAAENEQQEDLLLERMLMLFYWPARLVQPDLHRLQDLAPPTKKARLD